jgi:signal transduction histidine kinase
MTRLAAFARTLRGRLLIATFVAAGVAVAVSGAVLSGLFREHVTRQFQQALAVQLDQLAEAFEVDAEGRPTVAADALSDPRWTRPLGGLYWQVDRQAPGGVHDRAVLRSRSLWDTELHLPTDALDDGQVHVHELDGPSGQPLLVVERSVRWGVGDATAWRLLVAGDRTPTEAAVAEFRGVLLLSAAGLLGLLGVAALAQVRLGLAPLRALQAALADVRAARAPRLQGRFPLELQPLVDDFNAVLDRNATLVERARTQAGNLAHALKTPLAAMAQGAEAARLGGGAGAPLPALVAEQVERARRQVDWHLARARAAAAGSPGARAEVRPVVEGIARVLRRVHAERAVVFDGHGVAADAVFAGEADDLQEMVGNLMDNAAQWARREVSVRAGLRPSPDRTLEGSPGVARRLWLRVDDDGPGIAPEQRERALARGGRLDESVPGSGLGLAITHEIADLYGGRLALGVSPLGGLSAELDLPAPADGPVAPPGVQRGGTAAPAAGGAARRA